MARELADPVADAIFDLLVDEFEEHHRVDLSADATASARLADAARRASAALEESDWTVIDQPYIWVDKRGPLHLRRMITRDELFEPDEAPAVPPHHGVPFRPFVDDAQAPIADVPAPVRWRPNIARWAVRGLAALVLLFVLLVGWLALTAPLSKSLQPPTPPSITLLASDGRPIARRGAIIDKPVDAAKLPKHVTGAFVAIEDRRFYSHWGVDPHGILRAMFHNVAKGGLREGGSTITQQLAKNAFLDSDRTAGRKMREMLIAFWLEAWLSKDQILSRYLSNVYFGDNVYGLRAAARHYFGRAPEDLSIGQAAMLAGLVKAPSRLAPTANLSGAQAREMVVVNAMKETGVITPDEAAAVQPQRVKGSAATTLPNGTYFADWVLPQAREAGGDPNVEQTVQTTLDRRLQAAAERAAHGVPGKLQVAIVAMRPDGRVVAMVGGKDYGASPFNRATQARRQPGSTFKLFVYLAAMRAGLSPDSTVQDAPIRIGDWAPENSDRQYRGEITLREAFARSSNVAAARVEQRVGVPQVIKAARDLGISTPIPDEATIALGTSTVSLLELTSAYAAVAAGEYPVRALGVDAGGKGSDSRDWLASLTGNRHRLGDGVRSEMMDLLSSSVSTGTGRQAALSIDTYGKTGTTQDSRDALFIGFANGLVCGVWIGNDDNSPSSGLSGGGIPARVWRSFMERALGVGPKQAPQPVPATVDPDAAPIAPDDPDNEQGGLFDGDFRGLGLNLHVGRDGTISLDRDRHDQQPPRRRRDDGPPPDEGDNGQ